MDYLIKQAPADDGLRFIARGPEHGLKFIDFGILRLPAGATGRYQFDGQETGLVVLSGRCALTCGGTTYTGLGERADVFSGPAAAAYVPPGEAFTLAGERAAEIALALAPAERPAGAARIVRPSDVRVNQRGRDNWSRQVHDIIDERVEAGRLLIGETFNPPGNWSSYPPHKHEQVLPGLESKHEEVYYFKMNPSQGFALMRLYRDGGRDQAIVVQDGDTVLLPDGYHPVAAAPGYQVYYLWILAGKERALLMHDDPQHTWVKQPNASRPADAL